MAVEPGGSAPWETRRAVTRPGRYRCSAASSSDSAAVTVSASRRIRGQNQRTRSPPASWAGRVDPYAPGGNDPEVLEQSLARAPELEVEPARVVEQGESYALAKSESIQARKFLPGFDEPGLKATYDITLTIPAGTLIIADAAEGIHRRRPITAGLAAAPQRVLAERWQSRRSCPRCPATG